ncbi:hypothetical protein BDV10DRAFT_46314 [Aspergillus recurvatus]
MTLLVLRRARGRGGHVWGAPILTVPCFADQAIVLKIESTHLTRPLLLLFITVAIAPTGGQDTRTIKILHVETAPVSFQRIYAVPRISSPRLNPHLSGGPGWKRRIAGWNVNLPPDLPFAREMVQFFAGQAPTPEFNVSLCMTFCSQSGDVRTPDHETRRDSTVSSLSSDHYD